MRRPVDRRAFRDELQRAREFSLQRQRQCLSVRTWSLLHIKAVTAVLDDPLFGESDGIKRIVHSYLGYAPSGIKLAAGSADRRLRIVDAATGAVEKVVPHDGWVRSVAWSPSGTKVATGSHDEWLRIVDAATGAVEQEVRHEGSVLCVAWSPSGTKVATVSFHTPLRIIDAATGAVEQEVPHRDLVKSVAWSP